MPRKSQADRPLTLAQFERIFDERLDERFGRFTQSLIKFYQDLIEPRFQKIEAKLEEHDRRFDQVDGRFDDLYKKFDTLEQEYLFVNHQMKRLEKYGDLQEGEMVDLKQRVLNLETRMTKVEKDLPK